MPLIKRTSIDQIKARVTLSEVVGEQVQLKRAGSNLVGLCPFHAERSSSFHVHDSEGYYYCFGCGATGNLFTFIMKSKGLSFVESVEELAGRFNIPLEYESGRAAVSDGGKVKPLLYRVMALAQKFFVSQLESAPEPIQKYLRDRNLRPDTIKRFGVGLAPNQNNALLSFLERNKVPRELIEKAGLIRRNQRGELYDTFRGRLLFPVYVDAERIAGFGGRILPQLFGGNPPDGAPKYLNSPESPVYQKQKIFYGLPQAMAALRREGHAYLVEGYVDHLGLFQAGVENVVATCGTAVTDRHVQRLKGLVKRLTVLFDGDAAGRAAAGKMFPTMRGSGIDAEAAFLPEGKDPDDFAAEHAEHTAGELKKLPRQPLFECFIDGIVSKLGVSHAKDLGSSLKGRAAVDVAEEIRGIENPVERADLVQRAAYKLLISGADLTELVVKSAKEARGALENGSGVAKFSATEASFSSDAEDSPGETEAGDSKGVPPSLVRSPAELPQLDRITLQVGMANWETVPNEILKDALIAPELQHETVALLTGLVDAAGYEGTDEVKHVKVKSLLSHFGSAWKDSWRDAFKLRTEKDVDLPQMLEDCRRLAKRGELRRALESLGRRKLEAKTDAERMSVLTEELKIKRLMQEKSGGLSLNR